MSLPRILTFAQGHCRRNPNDLTPTKRRVLNELFEYLMRMEKRIAESHARDRTLAEISARYAKKLLMSEGHHT
jgi:hypothetical protein